METEPKAGFTNRYIYQPPKNLLLPDKIQALVLYQSQGEFFNKYLPVNKVGNTYQFVLKTPDSVSVLIMGIVDEKVNLADYSALSAFKKKVVDNNTSSGFIFYMRNKKNQQFPERDIQLASLQNGYSSYFIDVKTSNTYLITLYTNAYEKYPELKNEDSYADYISVLYDVKKDLVKPKLISYAHQMENVQGDETKWLNAVDIYDLLKMNDEKIVLTNKILIEFPNGKLAKKLFWKNFYKNIEGDTGQSILDSMKNYILRFDDTSYKTKDVFYSAVISKILNKKDWNALPEYEGLMTDKSYLGYTYDNFAWKQSGKEINTPGSELEIAKMLSKKSIQYNDEGKNTGGIDKQDEYMEGARIKYINTYALILYKLGQYDAAFLYQDTMYKRGNELNVAGIERYAVYAEKVKGAEYARQVLEQQLISGVSSPAMVQQLQSLYTKLNLPEGQFKKLQAKSILLSRQKSAAAIRLKLGTTKAKDFSLKNIDGQTISLSLFTGKIIVLDFWATWCSPCIASFLDMQKVIKKYNEDTSVVFLFIDVWENKSPEKMQQLAARFIKERNYDFNVLLDANDKVVNEYKVTGIPAKFIIDKKGEIVFMGETTNIEIEIENARN
jgi:peroxiredoxin